MNTETLTYEVFGVRHGEEVRQKDPFDERGVHQHWSVPTPWVVCGTATGRYRSVGGRHILSLLYTIFTEYEMISLCDHSTKTPKPQIVQIFDHNTIR